MSGGGGENEAVVEEEEVVVHMDLRRTLPCRATQEARLLTMEKQCAFAQPVSIANCVAALCS
jgi:hypothetical protein